MSSMAQAQLAHVYLNGLLQHWGGGTYAVSMQVQEYLVGLIVAAATSRTPGDAANLSMTINQFTGISPSVGRNATTTTEFVGAVESMLEGVARGQSPDMVHQAMSGEDRKDGSLGLKECVLPDDASLLEGEDLLGFCLPDSIDDVATGDASTVMLTNAPEQSAAHAKLNAAAPSFVPRASPPRMMGSPGPSHQLPPPSPYHHHGMISSPPPPPPMVMLGGAMAMQPVSAPPLPPGVGSAERSHAYGDYPVVVGNGEVMNAGNGDLMEALEMLQMQAPGYDTDSLMSIFAANGYDIDATLDVIAQMEGFEDKAVEPPPALDDHLNFPSLGDSGKKGTSPAPRPLIEHRGMNKK